MEQKKTNKLDSLTDKIGIGIMVFSALIAFLRGTMEIINMIQNLRSK